MKKKFKIKYIFSLFIIILVLIILGILIVNKKTDQEKLEYSLQNMAKDYYENFYYNQISNKEDFLKDYKDIGIKIALEDLEKYADGKYKEEISKFTDSGSSIKCNKYNTEAVIYPKSPYRKDSYTLKVVLDCEKDNN